MIFTIASHECSACKLKKFGIVNISYIILRLFLVRPIGTRRARAVRFAGLATDPLDTDRNRVV